MKKWPKLWSTCCTKGNQKRKFSRCVVWWFKNGCRINASPWWPTIRLEPVRPSSMPMPSLLVRRNNLAELATKRQKRSGCKHFARAERNALPEAWLTDRPHTEQLLVHQRAINALLIHQKAMIWVDQIWFTQRVHQCIIDSPCPMAILAPTAMVPWLAQSGGCEATSKVHGGNWQRNQPSIGFNYPEFDVSWIVSSDAFWSWKVSQRWIMELAKAPQRNAHFKVKPFGHNKRTLI